MTDILIKIFSFNAAYRLGKDSLHNRKIMIDEIKMGKYNIIVLQECNKNFVEYIKSLDYNVHYFNGNAIISKRNFEIISGKDRHYISCKYNYNGTIVNICCIHLPANNVNNKQKIAKSSKIRYDMLSSLFSIFDGENTIFAGDTNMRRNEFNVLETNYPDAKLSKIYATFDDFPYDRIIILGEKLKYINNKTFVKDMGIGSDHKALISTVSLNNGRLCNYPDFIANIANIINKTDSNVIASQVGESLSNIIKSHPIDCIIGASVLAALLYYNRK